MIYLELSILIDATSYATLSNVWMNIVSAQRTLLTTFFFSRDIISLSSKVILNDQLPGSSGLSAFKWYSTIPANLNTPLVSLSTNAVALSGSVTLIRDKAAAIDVKNVLIIRSGLSSTSALPALAALNV